MIYVIGNWNAPVKIGYTRDEASLKRRISALNTSSSHKLRVISVGQGERIDEKMLHAFLSQYRLTGEWFKADWRDPLLRNVIRVLPAIGAKGILSHTTDNLRNFISFPVVKPYPGEVRWTCRHLQGLPAGESW